tara:strand:- start:7754 stop:8581 length:828 start_codon:yes stop_codon:yes gene_type:complete
MNEYEVVICSHPKDFTKLTKVVRMAATYLEPAPNRFNIIVPDFAYSDVYKQRLGMLETALGIPVKFYSDSQVLSQDRSKIKYRKNWIFQQFLTLFNDITDTDYYLDIKSDAIILKPFQVFDKEGNPRLFVSRSEGYKEYYWNFSKKMIGLDQEQDEYSFICDIMMFSKKKIKAMIELSGLESSDEFIEKSIEIIDEESRTWLSEYELYGNYVFKKHSDLYKIKKINRKILGIEDKSWDSQMIFHSMGRCLYEGFEMTALNSWTTEKSEPVAEGEE